MKIVRTDAEISTPHLDQQLVELGHELILLSDDTTEQAFHNALRDADLLLMCYRKVTEACLSNAAKLKGIVKYGVGIDAIDIAAAKARNIVVVNIPDYGAETVAEGAFTLLLALAKKLIPLDRQMHREGWAWPEPQWMGSDIAGKTVGLIGFGKIARSMARMAGDGFRAKVIAYSPHNSAEEMAAAGVEKTAHLDTLMQSSDFVSVHCTLTPETRHLIGQPELRLMQPHAFLINVSRGDIVDEQALLNALKEKRIAGAGLDVYSQEPLSTTDHPLSALFEHPSVILSPHLTFYTKEAMQRLEEETILRCTEILNGQPVLIKSRDTRLSAQAHPASYL